MREWSTLRRLMFIKGAMAGGKLVEDTATGNPLTFITDKAKPLKSLLIPFTPKQSGSGNPSPQNIRPILPWSGLTVLNFAENLLNINSTGKTQAGMSYTTVEKGGKRVAVRVSGETTDNNSFFNLNYVSGETLSISPGNYKVYGYTEKVGFRVYYVDANGIQRNALITDVPEPVNTFTIPSGAKCSWMRLQAAPNVQIDELIYPILIPEDEPITEADISFPSPVYGGEHEAVSGVLQARQYDSITFRWGDSTGRTVIGNVERRGFIVPRQVKSPDDLHADPTARFCSVAPWKYDYTSDDVHYYGGAYSFYVFLPVGTDENLEFQLVVERPLPPQEQTLTGHQITALVGDNTIWSDADGQMTAVYLKKG